MKIPRLPSIHDYGKAKPTNDHLAPCRGYLNAELAKALKHDALKPGDLQELKTHGLSTEDTSRIDKVLQWSLSIYGMQLDGVTRNRWTRLIEKDIDLNQDKRLTMDELSLYAYRLDQAGDKNGEVSYHEKLYGLMLSHQNYMVEESERLGLGQSLRTRLIRLLHSRRFSVNQPELINCFDLPKSRTSKTILINKIDKLSESYDKLAKRLSAIPEAKKTRVLQALFKLFVQKGHFPALLPPLDSNQKPLDHFPDQLPIQATVFLISQERPGPLNSVRRKVEQLVYRFRQLGNRGHIAPFWHLVSSTSHGEYTCKNNRRYRIKPEEIRENTTSSAGLAVYRSLEECNKRVTSRLGQDDMVQQIQKTIAEFDHLVQTPALLQAATEPLAEAMMASLGIQGVSYHVRDKVLERDNEPDKSDQVCGRFAFRDQGAKRFIEMNQSHYLDYYNQKLAGENRSNDLYKKLGQVDYILTDSQLRDKVKADSFIAFMNTLAEEVMHAYQWQLKDGKVPPKVDFPEDRIHDYEDGFQVYVPPQRLVAALSGDSMLYHQHPLELDAKWFAKRIEWFLEKHYEPTV